MVRFAGEGWKGGGTVRQVFGYFRGAVAAYPRRFSVALFYIGCVTVMNAAMPWALRVFLDWLTERGDVGVLVGGVLFFAAFLLGRTFLTMRWYTSLDRFAGGYMQSLMLEMEARMAGAAYTEIERMPGGTIRNILYTDVLNVFRVVGVFLPSMISSVAVVLISLGISFFYGARVTGLILMAVVLGMALSWGSRRALSRTAGQTNARLKALDAWSTQFVDMLPIVQNNDVLGYYQKRTTEHIDAFIQTAMREDRAVYFWHGMTTGYHVLFSIVLSAVLAMPQAGGSIVNLVFFTTISSLIMQHAQTVETMFRTIVKNLPSFAHVQGLLDLPEVFGAREVGAIEEIVAEDVGFTYAGGVRALWGVNCALRKGECVQLRGANGSGKSTLIKLLTGMYLPTEGEIRINGQPMTRFARKALNRQILYVNQDEGCLNETFRAYLEIMAGEPMTDARFAELMDFVRLQDDGRRIEGNGASLSVGQRKKLHVLKLLAGIDRASVVILDELSAGMDVETAGRVYGLLDEMIRRRERIFVLVEHVMPRAVCVDRVLVVEAGRVSASGLDDT